MCRFLVYKGRDILMSDLLLKTEQSLIIQSFHAKERQEPLNGDGFGVGWYAPEIDPTPCVYTSIQPAWSNRNLFRLAEAGTTIMVSTHYMDEAERCHGIAILDLGKLVAAGTPAALAARRLRSDGHHRRPGQPSVRASIGSPPPTWSMCHQSPKA